MIRALREFRLTPTVALWLVADAFMVSFAMLTGIVARFLWKVGVEGTDRAASELLARYMQAYGTNVWVLLCIALPIFFLFGFYSRGRYYTGRYKALVVAQAVLLSYLVFGFVIYIADREVFVPRGAWVIGFSITLVWMVFARIWTELAQRLIGRDAPATLSSKRRVEKILVIGGAGYIGSALLPKLLDAGYKVRLLDMLLFGREPIEDVYDHPNLEIVRADFRHVDKVVEAVHGMDAVVHLGAIVGDPACALDEDVTIEINLMATRMIGEVAKASKVQRFIFASTCSVYGAGEHVLDERSALRPVSLYARSKIASERVLRNLADDNFAPTYLRFGTLYGLSGRTRFDLVVNLLTAKAFKDREITIHGGSQWRPFVHVDDAALAVFAALEAPFAVVKNDTFNVGSNDQNLRIEQVGEIVQAAVPDARVVQMGSDSDPRNYRVDFTKIRNLLGFKPQWTVEAGVRQVLEAFESGEIDDYKDVRYSNVKFLREDAASGVNQREFDWAYRLIEESSSQESVDDDGDTTSGDGPDEQPAAKES